MHIKNIFSARAASLSDIDESMRIRKKKKAKTGVLRSNKSPKKAHRNHIIQRYCVIFNKSGIPERKYKLHSDEDCTGV